MSVMRVAMCGCRAPVLCGRMCPPEGSLKASPDVIDEGLPHVVVVHHWIDSPINLGCLSKGVPVIGNGDFCGAVAWRIKFCKASATALSSGGRCCCNGAACVATGRRVPLQSSLMSCPESLLLMGPGFLLSPLVSEKSGLSSPRLVRVDRCDYFQEHCSEDVDC